jgi:hypothetical protein
MRKYLLPALLAVATATPAIAADVGFKVHWMRPRATSMCTGIGVRDDGDGTYFLQKSHAMFSTLETILIISKTNNKPVTIHGTGTQIQCAAGGATYDVILDVEWGEW